MRKIFVGLVCLGLMLGLCNIAAAEWFVEEYGVGQSGPQQVASGETFFFSFDFQLSPNFDFVVPEPFEGATNSNLDLLQDAQLPDPLAPWYYAAIEVSVCDYGNTLTADSFSVITWDLFADFETGENPVYPVVVGFSSQGNGLYSLVFGPSALDSNSFESFAYNGWGRVEVTNTGCGALLISDVKMSVSTDPLPPVAEPVPEPSTILLLGAGLLGIAAYGHKKMKK